MSYNTRSIFYVPVPQHSEKLDNKEAGKTEEEHQSNRINKNFLIRVNSSIGIHLWDGDVHWAANDLQEESSHNPQEIADEKHESCLKK